MIARVHTSGESCAWLEPRRVDTLCFRSCLIHTRTGQADLSDGQAGLSNCQAGLSDASIFLLRDGEAVVFLIKEWRTCGSKRWKAYGIAC